ncbi:uncharacterized protein [Antedon mediterranea]|uniref:uncharacterized protein isoform X2 n=1 Tax=Antedon mediterranea TaxID=105859 RepID=UPI003AF416C9
MEELPLTSVDKSNLLRAITYVKQETNSKEKNILSLLAFEKKFTRSTTLNYFEKLMNHNLITTQDVSVMYEILLLIGNKRLWTSVREKLVADNGKVPDYKYDVTKESKHFSDFRLALVEVGLQFTGDLEEFQFLYGIKDFSCIWKVLLHLEQKVILDKSDVASLKKFQERLKEAGDFSGSRTIEQYVAKKFENSSNCVMEPATTTPTYFSPTGSGNFSFDSDMSYPPYAGSGYPPAGGAGYPPAGGAGYPPAGGAGYPPAAGGYPPQGGAGGYPPQPGYPPSGGGYPPQQPGFPAAGGYSPAGGGYPPAPSGPPGGGYPPQQAGYPPQPSAGYPQPAGGMPTPGGGGYQPGGGLPYNPSPLGFAGAAMATTAFRPQHTAGSTMPMPAPVPAAAPYQPPSQAPPQQHYQPPPSQQPSRQGSQHASQPPSSQMSNMSIGGSYQYRGHGIVKDKPGFDGHREAEILRKAMKGIGTDEKAIIDVLTSCSNKQRQKVILDYKTMYGKDLISNLKGEIKGKFEDVVLGLLQLPAVFDAHQLRKAMKGVGTDEAVLIEILCSRSNQQIKEIKEAYKKEFKRDLEKDIVSETSGHFKRLLVSMVQGGRSESLQTDTFKAKEDAKALYEAGEKRWGTDESRFNAIFASRSVPQLRLIFEEYTKISRNSMEATIKSEMSGDLENGMLTIISCVRNTPKYFAERLYKSMKGLGTDDTTLIRCMVSRCEIDMVEIKEEFKRSYKQTLGRFISGDTSGDYKRILIALAGGEN